SEPGDLNRHRCCDGEGECLEGSARCESRRVAAAQQLFPESTRVLARELTRELVDVAHPLDADQERLVVGEAAGVQIGDLLAKMVLELVDVVAVDIRRPRYECAPLGNLRLDSL